MNFNYSPLADFKFNDSILQESTSKILSEISSQKDKLIFEALKENNAPINDLTELMKQCKFIKLIDENYQILNYNGCDLVIFYNPEFLCEQGKFKVEMRYKKLY